MDRRLFFTILAGCAAFPRSFAKTAYAQINTDTSKVEDDKHCFFARTTDIDTCSHTFAPESMISDNENI